MFYISFYGHLTLLLSMSKRPLTVQSLFLHNDLLEGEGQGVLYNVLVNRVIGQTVRLLTVEAQLSNPCVLTY